MIFSTSLVSVPAFKNPQPVTPPRKCSLLALNPTFTSTRCGIVCATAFAGPPLSTTMFDAAFSGATMLNGIPDTLTVPVLLNSNDSFFAAALW